MNSDFCSRVVGLIEKTGLELMLLRALYMAAFSNVGFVQCWLRAHVASFCVDTMLR